MYSLSEALQRMHCIISAFLISVYNISFLVWCFLWMEDPDIWHCRVWVRFISFVLKIYFLCFHYMKMCFQIDIIQTLNWVILGVTYIKWVHSFSIKKINKKVRKINVFRPKKKQTKLSDKLMLLVLSWWCTVRV